MFPGSFLYTYKTNRILAIQEVGDIAHKYALSQGVTLCALDLCPMPSMRMVVTALKPEQGDVGWDKELPYTIFDSESQRNISIGYFTCSPWCGSLDCRKIILAKNSAATRISSDMGSIGQMTRREMKTASIFSRMKNGQERALESQVPISLITRLNSDSTTMERDYPKDGPLNLSRPPPLKMGEELTKTTEIQTTCRTCGSVGRGYDLCGRCKTMSYCSKQCQIDHWLGGHMKVCAIIAQSNIKFDVKAELLKIVKVG